MKPLILRARGEKNSHSITSYLKFGGYTALKKALIMNPEDVLAEVRSSRLRGRSTGDEVGPRWTRVAKQPSKNRYLVCNATATEPGAFVDREIIPTDPHMILEGLIIAAYAIGAHTAFFAVSGEFPAEADILDETIRQARRKKYLGKNILKMGFDLEVEVHRGASMILGGDQTSLIESIEGNKGLPRVTPAPVTESGLFGSPTVVHSVETLTQLPHILENGGQWYAKIGTESSTGTKLLAVSGKVERPGVVEVAMGTTFREVIEERCGGMTGGRKLKAFFPGGVVAPILEAEALQTPVCFDEVEQAGSRLGSGALIVIDDQTEMVGVLANLLELYAEESCGQCTPCREGSAVANRVINRIRRGKAWPGDLTKLRLILETSRGGMSLCTFGDAFARTATSLIDLCEGELKRAVAGGSPTTRPFEPALPVKSAAGLSMFGRLKGEECQG